MTFCKVIDCLSFHYANYLTHIFTISLQIVILRLCTHTNTLKFKQNDKV